MKKLDVLYQTAMGIQRKMGVRDDCLDWSVMGHNLGKMVLGVNHNIEMVVIFYIRMPRIAFGTN